MKFTDLKQGNIYDNITDLAIPLMYTGNFKDTSTDIKTIQCEFKPIKTDKNKNWFDAKKVYHFNFRGENLENPIIR
ncbi:MAG: hypothetical protein RLZZ605_663 [Bacteroidota bacterium]|jgi:hypothetical protein